MQIHDGELPRARQLARTGKELSREARVRLDWMDFHRRCQNVARTCRHFGISRQTFYRWRRRYDPQNLSTLQDRSHQPRHRRQPTWTPAVAERVLALRRRFPCWGKDKLAVLLRQQHIRVSTSMVGRILTRMKRQGRLIEPLRSGVVGSRRALRPRPYAVRKPKQYAVSRPGDLVQVDISATHTQCNIRFLLGPRRGRVYTLPEPWRNFGIYSPATARCSDQESDTNRKGASTRLSYPKFRRIRDPHLTPNPRPMHAQFESLLHVAPANPQV